MEIGDKSRTTAAKFRYRVFKGALICTFAFIFIGN